MYPHSYSLILVRTHSSKIKAEFLSLTLSPKHDVPIVNIIQILKLELFYAETLDLRL